MATHESLAIINHPPQRLPGPSLLHLLVHADNAQLRAADTNNVPAIDFLPSARSQTTTTISYAQLHHASNALAAKITSLAKVPPDAPQFVVPVLVPQSPHLYIALLAVLKAGGAFCPLNLDVPTERAKFILEDVDARVIITVAEYSSNLTSDDPKRVVLIIDDDAVTRDEPPGHVEHRKAGPDDLAYVMYTSGSTGTPKGVGVSHDAAVQSLLAHDRHIPPFERFLQFAAPTFDVSVFEIFFPLYKCKTLVSCARQAMLNDLPGVMRRMNVDACELTPSVAGSLLRKRENAPELRVLLTIGEMLIKPVVEEFGGSGQRPSMLWGMYGPTEAAIHCTVHPEFASSTAVSDIGVPFDTVSAFILDLPEDDSTYCEFRVLPRGEIGELAVGGPQVAQGYINRPELTAKAFIDTLYGRLYRTGDKARIQPDGTLECLGRIGGGQVKLRGQRIELGEIEHAALRTEGCHGSVAAVINNIIVLFCAVDHTDQIVSAITESCKSWLPGFMVPGDIIVTKEFPRLPSGKIDRKTMIADYSNRSQHNDQVDATTFQDELEERLCKLVGAALGTKVNPRQSLIQAGLDSLTAIKLASSLRQDGLSTSIGAVDILAARSVSALRSQVLQLGVRGIPEQLWGVTDYQNVIAEFPQLRSMRDIIEHIHPCTPLQTSMLAETVANPRAYCNWIELLFPSDFAEATIRSWFQQLAQDNEILRSGFLHHRAEFLQIVFNSLNESAISTSDSLTRDFELTKDDDFLRPFRVQISTSSSSNGTTAVIQLHHAVYDGWSWDSLMLDLARLVKGDQVELRPQFRSVSSYFHSATFADTSNRAKEFWAEYLLDFQPPPLPILRAEVGNTSDVSSYSATVNLSPSELQKNLTDVHCGIQTIFQASLAWLWGSMVGTEDVVVGSVTSGRTIPVPNIEDVIGPCIASVPIRTNILQVRTLKELLISVQSASRATLRHSILPLADIKRAAGIRLGQPIYDVLFVYQESLNSKKRASSVIKEVGHQDYLETRLLVEVEPKDNEFVIRVTYHHDTFHPQQIEFMTEHLQTLASYCVKNLDADMESIGSIFSRSQLSIFNPQPKSFSGIPDLARAVELVARRTPEKPALCFADNISEDAVRSTTITFDQLDQEANRISWYLIREKNVKPGGVVAIVMDKSVNLYVGILAILKAGCAYLPLLPTTPLPRIQLIFEKAAVNICLTDTATYGKLKTGLPSEFVDLATQDFSSFPTTSNFAHRPDPNRLAYVIFTSGSTGTPKGVCVTQLNMTSNLDVLSRIYPGGPEARLLQSCSQAFDVSVFEIFFTWTQGMCLCSGTNDMLFADLELSIRKLDVTHLSMTPTVASLVNPAKVPGVRFLVTAGEPMTETVARKWGDKLFQGYGPSETTNICSVKKMGRPNQAIRHLGWSLENTSTFVMPKDGGLDIVPLGCLGEFCFGGDQVAQGYLGVPELTAQKFIQHPEFGRLYRSGDLGRMLPDGSMVIVGRVDDQIKIRGQRVELGEVTSLLRPSEDCVTILVRGDGTSADQIISFVVPVGQKDSTDCHLLELANPELQHQIREFHQLLGSHLPAYMIPSAIIPVSVLPTTPSGKLDRPRLLQAFRSLTQEQLGVLSPGAESDGDTEEWADVELRVADAISVALGVRRQDVRRLRPLVTLGLDSISAIQVAKEIKTGFDIQCPISLILQNPTVARLATAVRELMAATRERVTKQEVLLPERVVDAVTQKLRRHGITFTTILPCTPLQEAMLAASAGKRSYVNRMLFRIKVDLTKLRDAWDQMTTRHDILRTCFVKTNDIQRPLVQVVLRSCKTRWLELEAAESSVDSYVDYQVSLLPDGIDSLEPAVSFAIIDKKEEIFLSFVCHHALYDGVAIDRLLYEVEQTLYDQSLSRTPSYEDFLRTSLYLPDSTDVFWLDHLSEFEPKLITDLILNGPEPRSFTESFTFSEIPLTRVRKHARDLGTSLLALMQTSWATTLACVFHTGDVCFGNVVNGRSVPVNGIDELVAPCFNTIPVRMEIEENRNRKANLQVMKSFQRLNSDMIKYQFTPLRKIQGLVGGKRLFDTLLLMQNGTRQLDSSLWEVISDEGEMDVPVVCEVVPDTQRDSLAVKLHIHGGTLSRKTARVLLDVFTCSLRSALEFPAALIIGADGLSGLTKEKLPILQAKPDPRVQASSTADRETWTTTETAIRTVLAGFSASNGNIKRDTTIYQLGLDSISAVHIASALRESGIQVLASDIISNPTCASLARFIESNRQASTSKMALKYNFAGFGAQIQRQLVAQGIDMDAVQAVIPCTPLQAGMMAQFLQSGGQDYFNTLQLRFLPEINPCEIRAAWERVCEAHPILRTGLISVEHNNCAFAVVQWRSNNIWSREDSEDHIPRPINSDLVIESPHKQLWKMIVAEGESAEEGAVMVLGIHHALYDARSLRLILQDFSRALRGADLKGSVSIEKAALDILSQTSGLAGTTNAFWKDQADKVVINGFPVLTPLRKHERKILTQSTASTVPLATLEKAIASAGYTMQAVLQAAWARILSSYLGETSVVFGVVLSGRNTDATRDAVFPCITTLPVIAENSESNQHLLERMLQYNTQLYKQQHQPLTRIQQWLGVPDTKLFDTLLVYQKFDIGESEVYPWCIEKESAHVDYPLSIEIEPTTDGGVGYQVTFFDDVLPKEQAVILLQQFDAVVQHLALEPEGNESDLSVAVPHVFSVLPPEEATLPTEIKFLHQFMERQAIETPEVVALHFVQSFRGDRPVGQEWTYSEVNANGNRVGNLLAPRVKAGDIVAVYFDKCPEAYFSILGILKSGCAFVALDPSAPASRNEFIIGDSGASVLLTSAEKASQLGFPVSVPVVSIEETSLAYASSKPLALSRPLQPNDVCYCLYTSGTTGTPKGCEITHDNAVQCMLAFRHIFRGHWESDSRWLQFASLHFDVSVLEQYWSWSVGITLVAAPRDVILEDLAGTISRLNITHIDLTPSLARLVHPDDVPSLCRGVFITGGESLKQEILDVWGDKGVIYNFYGPTEATIGVTVFPQVPANGRASNIGKQFINVGSYVLKPGTEQPVLKGGVGELCVSGQLVGKGYLKRDDLTAERFPTLSQFGDRIYRTGDLVRVLHDGCFDFLGRADDQVKLRGQRLEIGEINHAIRKGVDEVKDVATLVIRNDSQKKDFLVSFVVAGNYSGARQQLEVVEGPRASELCRQVRDACRTKLPGYMVPTYVLQLPFIPLSANNKAEMKQLRAFFGKISPERLVALASSTDQSSQVLTATGKKVAEAIAAMQQIDTESITPQSSIFELGIDSISVLRLTRALKNGGLQQATPALILSNPLIGDLSRALETNKPSPDSVAAARQVVSACAHKHRSLVCTELGASPEDVEYIAPCSALQEGMMSRPVAYCNSFRIKFASGVSPVQVQEAFGRLVAAFPILRTRFVMTSDGVIQAVLRNDKAIKVNMLLAGHEEGPLGLHRKDWVSRNKEFVSEPISAAIICHGNETQPEEVELLLNIFHGLYDANSLDLMLDHLAQQIEGNQTQDDAPSFLEALYHGPLQNFIGSKSFWVDHLRSFSLPAFLHAVSDLQVVNHACSVAFEDLESVRAGLGITHQALVQAAWVKVLQKRQSQNPTIGVIVSGRSIHLDGAERVVGPLFNTIPFHAQISPSNGRNQTTWETLLRQCHEFNTAVVDFQHVPLRDIQKWCSGGKPLFDTLFSFQREENSSTRRAQWLDVVQSEPNADYPLALEATLSADSKSLHLLLVAQEGRLIDSEGLLEMMAHLRGCLQEMASDTKAVIGSSKGMSQSSERMIDSPMREHSEDHDSGVAVSTRPSGEFDNGTDRDPRIHVLADCLRQEIAALAGLEGNGEAISESTSIFELGLDSIDAIKLSARLKERSVFLTTGQLMKAQTIRDMLVQLSDQQQRNEDRDRQIAPKLATTDRLKDYLSETLQVKLGPDFDRVKEFDVRPVTALQDSMVADMLNSDFRLYFNHDILELSPSVDIGRLKKAWTDVILSPDNAIYTAWFLPVYSQGMGFGYCLVEGCDTRYMDGTPHFWFENTLKKGTSEELDNICETARQRAGAKDGCGDLLQLTLAKTMDSDRRFLVISIAHALYDGWSLGLLHQDVQAAYNGLRLPSRREPAGRLPSAVYSILQSGHEKEPEKFWSGYLAGSTPTILPATTTRPKSSGNSIHRKELVSSRSLTEISAFCKANGITIQVLGQACWAALLAYHTGGLLDVTFGVVLSGRDNAELENVSYPTMNTVAVRTILHGTIASWMRYMQNNMGSVRRFQHYPLLKAQRLAGSKGPLFNTLFMQQQQPAASSQADSERLWKSVDGFAAIEYPICVEIEMMSTGLVWRTACDTNHVSIEYSNALSAQLDSVLGHILQSSTHEVLLFSGKELSICGLPSIQLKRSDGSSSETLTDLVPAEDAERVWTPTELLIRDALAEVSGVPVESIHHGLSIYSLGLDSISAVKASSVLRKKGVKLGFRNMLRAKCISEMAELAQEKSEEEKTEESPDTVLPLEHLDVQGALKEHGITSAETALPATSMQIHMLSVWHNTKGAIFYPEFKYQLAGSGSVTLASITQAWNRLVAETPILRTVFIPINSWSIPMLQVVVSEADFEKNPPAVEATRHRYTRLLNKLRKKLHLGSTSTPADAWVACTSKGPLTQPYNCLEVRRERKKQDVWALRLRIHHALYDAVSLPVIMKRFAELVQASDQQVQESQEQSQAPMHSVWEQAIAAELSSSAKGSLESFWKTYLKGVQISTDKLTTHKLVSSNVSSRTSVFRRSVIPDVSNISKLCRTNGVSIQSLFFAAYAHFLSTEKGDDVVFGIYLANRAEEYEELTTYPTLRLVPLRVKLNGPIWTVAKKIQEDIHSIMTGRNASVGLWQIKEWTGIVIDSFVNFLGAGTAAKDNGDGRDGKIRLEVLKDVDVEGGEDNDVKYAEEDMKHMEGKENSGHADVGEHVGVQIREAKEFVRVREAYPAAVDVEVALDEDAGMDIGVFGMGCKIDEDGARKVVEGVVGILTGLE
ncbi:non-ribosomal peptide synthetase [Cladorrhinum sp. PSN259]|nr:non-ribosomal peptide synthetase [Cladorrhinum sp. PSN259]